MNLSLAQALRATEHPCIAFVGAGGKTTALFQLARELKSPVIVTATSHLGVWQTEFADHHIIANSIDGLKLLETSHDGVTLITGEVEGERTKPVNDEVLHWLHDLCLQHSLPLLIEADGSRQKPLKAWETHEPPIPAFVDLVVNVVGLSGFGKPLNEEWIHRPEIFSQISGLQLNETVTAESILRVITHPDGWLKNIPVDARKVVLLNQADTAELQAIANNMSQSLLKQFDAVVIAQLKEKQIFAVREPVAGIILAAGESSRFGQVKQLLDWKGEPFVRVVAKIALEAGLSPVLVVTGSNAEEVETAIQDLPVTIVRNKEWKEGQASSIRVGVRALPKQTGAAIFLLSDQPQITTTVLHALMEGHAAELPAILAPMVQDQRANPVLFDHVTFRDLLKLQGDVGGRGIFHAHRVSYLPWHDDRLLLDVDTPEMYQRLITDDTL